MDFLATSEEQVLYRQLVSDSSIWKRTWRALRALPYRLPDTGLPCFTRLRTHILVCGFPRSGTTLLLAMLEHGYPRARHFGREVSAWRAATLTWHNRSMLISKLPKDVLRLESIRAIYRRRRAELKIIIMVRDPRDVMTSRHAGATDREYFCDPVRFRVFHGFFKSERSAPDVMTLRYEDLVGDITGTQAAVEQFIGHRALNAFETFHEAQRKDFDVTPLNGVRPVDSGGIGRWKQPALQNRIQNLLHEMPELPGVLVEMGYETGGSWAEPYCVP